MIGMNSYIYINHLKVYCWVIIHWWIYHNLFLSIHPLKDILVASSFWLLQLKMVWTFMSIWAVVVFFFLDKYLGMEWLHYMVGCMFNYFLKFILIGGLLQYCGGFCHTWISYGCTCVPHPVSPSQPLLILSLRVIPVHWPWVPCLMHRAWTGDLFHIW